MPTAPKRVGFGWKSTGTGGDCAGDFPTLCGRRTLRASRRLEQARDPLPCSLWKRKYAAALAGRGQASGRFSATRCTAAPITGSALSGPRRNVVALSTAPEDEWMGRCNAPELAMSRRQRGSWCSTTWVNVEDTDKRLRAAQGRLHLSGLLRCGNATHTCDGQRHALPVRRFRGR